MDALLDNKVFFKSIHRPFQKALIKGLLQMSAKTHPWAKSGSLVKFIPFQCNILETFTFKLLKTVTTFLLSVAK